jgi:hypothetical protein
MPVASTAPSRLLPETRPKNANSTAKSRTAPGTVNNNAAKDTAKVIPKSKDVLGTVVAALHNAQASVETALPKTADNKTDTGGRHIGSLSDDRGFDAMSAFHPFRTSGLRLIADIRRAVT